MERRDFIRLGTILSAAAGAELFQPEGLSALPQRKASQPNPSLDFWQNRIRKPQSPLKLRPSMPPPNIEGTALPPPPPTQSELVNPSRNPVFAFLDQTQKKFVDATEITPGLADGDVDVTVKVARFRPSQDDETHFNNVKSGSLRIDVTQQEATPGAGQLAWSAIAGILPGGNGKLPDLSQLQFDPGTDWGQRKQIALPGGSGQWTWNFFLQKKDSIWEKILGQIHNALGGGAVPLVFAALSLPAISVTALGFADKLVGYLTNVSKEEYLFNSGNLSVTATQKGTTADPNTVRLATGWYLVVPQEHAQYLVTDDSLTITNEGCLVPSNTNSLNQYQVASATLPQMTYLSVYVTAAQAPSGTGH